MTKLHEAATLGHSIWLDNIRRSILTNGDLQKHIDHGLRGMTSNPSIFAKAISESDEYNEQIRSLAQQGKSTEEIYEAIVIADIQDAADLFMSVYEERQPVDGMAQNFGFDGYVSLEANPHLADDADGTIDEIRRLHKRVNRPNVMFKVPATAAGNQVIEQLISEGININVTLMFSMKHYDAVTNAYLSGLQARHRQGKPISTIASVASFFISRVDSKIDPILDKKGLDDLMGKIGIDNAKMVYQRFNQIFRSPRWNRLAQNGARLQRVLWGSTSTKNPDYPDTMYVDNLIGPHTINTVPPDTLDAFMDHGVVARTVDQNWMEARKQIDKLEKAKIDLLDIGAQLQREGVDKFVKAYDDLLATIAAKREAVAQH